MDYDRLRNQEREQPDSDPHKILVPQMKPQLHSLDIRDLMLGCRVAKCEIAYDG